MACIAGSDARTFSDVATASNTSRGCSRIRVYRSVIVTSPRVSCTRVWAPQRSVLFRLTCQSRLCDEFSPTFELAAQKLVYALRRIWRWRDIAKPLDPRLRLWIGDGLGDACMQPVHY